MDAAFVVAMHSSMSSPLHPPGNPNKIGFNTYAMWGLCFVVVGVCYYFEQKELAERPKAVSGIPADVQRVLPSGAWLMNDGSIKKPPQ